MVDPTVAAETCVALGATEHQFESFPGRDITLGALTVTRVLPVKGKRLVGPWCFLDRFGPLTFENPSPMDIGAHPHMGLQTVTWLLDGELVHYDSLGYESLLRPGGVNVMTSGAAIAHAERTPAQNSGRLSGVQLWVALPDRDRHGAALFQHVNRVPLDEEPGGISRHPAQRVLLDHTGELGRRQHRNAAGHPEPLRHRRFHPLANPARLLLPATEHDVAAVENRANVRVAEFGQQRPKVRHRDPLGPAYVDPPYQRHVPACHASTSSRPPNTQLNRSAYL